MTNITPKAIALVTGGSRGIGRSIVDRLASRCDVLSNIAVISRNEVELPDSKVNCSSFRCDVGDSEQVEETLKSVKLKFGDTPSLLVNAAGISRNALLARTSDKMIDEIMHINLMGTIYMTRGFVRGVIRGKKESGSVVNIGSVVGSCGNVGQSIYSASKAGLIGFTKSLGKELGPRNIAVNLIEPGFIKTEMTASLDEAVVCKSVPKGRFGNCEEISSFIEFLLLDQNATYMNGQVYRIDGGMF